MAEQEVAVHGAAASLEQIARTAGVGSATVRRHFPSRYALLAAVSRARIEALSARAHELTGRDDSRAALLEWLDEVVAYCVSARGLAAALSYNGTGSDTGAASANGAASDRSPTSDHGAASDLVHGNTCAASLEVAGSPLLHRAIQAGAVAPDVTVADLITLIVGLVLATEHHPDHAALVHRLFHLAVAGLSPLR